MTLPQNVKDAVKFANAECGKSSDFTFDMSGADWRTIHAHLLGQAAEIERLQSGLDAANKRLRFMRTRFDAYMDNSDRASIEVRLSENTHG